MNVLDTVLSKLKASTPTMAMQNMYYKAIWRDVPIPLSTRVASCRGHVHRGPIKVIHGRPAVCVSCQKKVECWQSREVKNVVIPPSPDDICTTICKLDATTRTHVGHFDKSIMDGRMRCSSCFTVVVCSDVFHVGDIILTKRGHVCNECGVITPYIPEVARYRKQRGTKTTKGKEPESKHVPKDVPTTEIAAFASKVMGRKMQHIDLFGPLGLDPHHNEAVFKYMARFTGSEWVKTLYKPTRQEPDRGVVTRLAKSELRTLSYLKRMRSLSDSWKLSWHGITCIPDANITAAAKMMSRLHAAIYEASLTTEKRRNAPHSRIYSLASIYLSSVGCCALWPIGISELAHVSVGGDKRVGVRQIRRAVNRMKKVLSLELDSYSNICVRFYDRFAHILLADKNPRFVKNGRLTLATFVKYVVVMEHGGISTTDAKGFHKRIASSLGSSQFESYLKTRKEISSISGCPSITQIRIISESILKDIKSGPNTKKQYLAAMKTGLAAYGTKKTIAWMLGVLSDHATYCTTHGSSIRAAFAAAAIKLTFPRTTSIIAFRTHFALCQNTILNYKKRIKTIVHPLRSRLHYHRVVSSSYHF